ncbi:MAG: FHA domain-containing protein [Acidobacteria bacterium]|nr:FHA domain-containing protein [Acidobacteriota bacterium]
MSEINNPTTKKSFSTDWLVRGILTKLGETFDQFTGRNWKPSSSLATSELIEKLKKLLDAEVKDLGEKGKFVPHNIKLLMQWDKFSTDAESALKKLEYELLTAAIDHINDKRYHTYAPMQLEIKPDYFTEGVKLLASFDKFTEDEREAAVNVTVPDLKNVVINPIEEEIAAPEKEIFIAEFKVTDKPQKVKLAFSEKERLSVGRTKENDLVINDPSISKIHAALVLNLDRQLMVADTGSTNGTFINNQRISYGRAVVINEGDKLKFGTVEVALEHIINEKEFVVAEDFSTKEEAIKEVVNSAKMVSINEVYSPKEDVATKEDVL